MNGNVILLPQVGASFLPDAHKFVRGGINMEIQHTHPEYETEEQRQSALKDVRQACLCAISALKNGADRTRSA